MTYSDIGFPNYEQQISTKVLPVVSSLKSRDCGIVWLLMFFSLPSLIFLKFPVSEPVSWISLPAITNIIFSKMEFHTLNNT